MADPRVRIVVEAVTQSAERQLRKLQGTVNDTGKEAKKSGGMFDDLGAAVGKIAAGVGVAASAFYGLKKAYDFAKEGAAIAQTAESFDRLMASMGVAPDILDQLRDASLGTVDDMTIMSSTMTLLAGTSEDLGKAMVDAAPDLMEIAKAAHKLNPAAGDVEYFYNSIATGIKRSSPLILDNLGLVVKVGDANEKMAAKLGKSVDALSAEEKQMALLTAVLDGGDRMIQQVGGSVEEMGDSFAEAETQIKNATDELKKSTAPVMAEVMGFLSDMVSGLEDTAEASDAIRKSADNYDEYLDAVLRTAEANHQLTQSDIDVIRQQAEMGEAFHRTVGDLGILTEAQYNAARETDRVSEKWATYAQALHDARPAATDLSQDTEDLAGNVQLVADMIEQRAIKAADDFKGSMETLSLAMRGEFGEAIDEYQTGLAELDAEFAAGEITASEYANGLDRLTVAFTENTNALIYNIAEKQILDALEKGLIEDVNNSGTAYDEATSALWANAEALGLVDEATLALMGSVQGQTSAFIDGTVTASQLAGGLSNLAGQAASAAAEGGNLKAAIDNLHDKTITVTTNYVSQGAHEESGPGPLQGGRQHGGPVSAGMRYLVGEAGPEVFVPNTGGYILPNTTNNYNLSIHSSAPAESAVADFHTMRALAGAN